MEVTEQELQGLYTWVDEIPLSRPKRNIGRDFSDGVLMAEVVHHYFPKLVELHNYSSANSTAQKLYNWNTLNQKVFKRLGFSVSKQEFESISNCVPGAIERLLKMAKLKLSKCREEGLPAPTMTATSTIPTAAMQTNVPNMMPMAPAAYEHMPAVMGMVPPQPRNLSQQPMSMMGKGPVGVPPEVLAEKEQAISELRETNEILETKVRKLEQLVRLKDAKIQTLMAKLQAAGLA